MSERGLGRYILLSYKQVNADIEQAQSVETAQHIAGHTSVGTTRISDHRNLKVAQEEIERVRI